MLAEGLRDLGLLRGSTDELLETEAWGKRPYFFEYWGHEASLLPVTLQPLFRWRMERARGGGAPALLDAWTEPPAPDSPPERSEP